MKKISFVKMSGAGNDFIVIDKDVNDLTALTYKVVNRLCSRRNGIGADGLITVSKDGNCDFAMDYYNADGFLGSLCGNGARCAIKFAQYTGKIKNNRTEFINNNRRYSGELFEDGTVKFNFGEPEDLRLNLPLKAGGKNIEAAFVNTGSPHVIVNITVLGINNITEVPVYELGKEIRHLAQFAPGGTNVNFIKISEDKVYIRTFERGVEDETYACGTGSVAAALVSSLKYDIKAPVQVITKGGNTLLVDFKYINSTFNNVSLTGPADIIYTGAIDLNKFL